MAVSSGAGRSAAAHAQRLLPLPLLQWRRPAHVARYVAAWCLQEVAAGSSMWQVRPLPCASLRQPARAVCQQRPLQRLFINAVVLAAAPLMHAEAA